jgi:Domain of unknown function (DUF4276)
VKVRIYVEGGPKGVDADGVRNFRNAFKRHFQQLDQGLKTMDVISHGSTEQTIKSYAQGVDLYSSDCAVALLVDSDAAVTAETPAKHLQAKLDSANVPSNARKNIFLMVQCMESWLVTDAAALGDCFGSKFRAAVLPANPDIEAVSKKDVLAALDAAVKPTPTGRYRKVEHGARILAKLNPETVANRSRHATSLHTFLRDSLKT